MFSLLLAACCVISASAQEAANTNTNTNQISTNIGGDAKVCPAGCCRPDGEAPAGVMTDHVHPKGSFMVSYSYMNMAMNGNRVGSRKTSDEEIFENYAMAGDKMTMQMHMLMLMYGVTDRLTVMAMGNYNVNTMTMTMSPNASCSGICMAGMNAGTIMDGAMRSTSSGIGDTKVYGLYSLLPKASKSRAIASLGVNIPTGSVTETGITMQSTSPGDYRRLAYNMQPGSGSFGLLPALTFVHDGYRFSWGGEAGANVNLDNNAQGYRLGNSANATAWASYRFCNFASFSLRDEFVSTGAISGRDAAIEVLSANDPNASGANYGGQRMNFYAGINLHSEAPALHGFRVLLEYGLPAYEHLNGPQMAVSGMGTATLQYMLHQ